MYVFNCVVCISVELISQGCVILHYPSWCIQHNWLYACMYLCIMNFVKCIYTHSMSLYSRIVLDPWIFVIPRKVILKKKWTTFCARLEGTLLPAKLLIGGIMGGKHHCCSIWRPWCPFCLGVATLRVCPTVYNCVQMCVYSITLRLRQRSVCAWLARMIYCATCRLVHDLAVPPRPFQWCCSSSEILRHTHMNVHFILFLKSGLWQQHLPHFHTVCVQALWRCRHRESLHMSVCSQ